MASLGRLTLDLVTKIGNFTGPIQQAEKQVQTSFANMRRDINLYGTAVAGVGVSAVTALGGLAIQTANQAAELERFAQRADTTTQEFQKMSVGAQAFGVSQENLSMMVRDFNEKLGELTAVGGGGAKDFYDRLAGHMDGGSEAAKSLIIDLQKLSGPEAMQKYVNELENAKVPQEEMSFFLESMAGDLTDLYPLLADGGEGFRMYGDMAERAGIIMTDSTMASALALKDQMFMLDLQMQGAKNQLVTAVIPAFLDISDAFFGSSEQGLQLTSVAEGVGNAIRTMGKVAIGAVATFQVFGKALGGLAAAGSALVAGDFAGAKAILAEMRADISTTALDAAAKMDAIDNRVGSTKANQLRATREVIERNREHGKGIDDIIAKENKAAKGTQARAKAQKEINRLTAEEIKLKELQFAYEVSQHRLTEDQAFRYKYSVDQQAIRADKELTASQKEIKLQALKEIYEGGYTALKISYQKELLETKRHWMTASDYAKEYYELIRQEILNTASYSPEMKNALVKEANFNQGMEQNADREKVWGDYQDRFGVKNSPYQQDMDLLDKALKHKLILEEQYQQQRLAMQSAYGAQYGADFAGMMMGLVDKSSTAYALLGAAQKGFTLFSVGLSSIDAIGKAWASAAFPYNMPAVAMATMETGLLQATVSALSPVGYADGGWTGYGGKYEVAGLVHRGEGVLNQEEIYAIGGPSGFNALRSAIKHGYSDGGLVGMDNVKLLNPQQNTAIQNFIKENPPQQKQSDTNVKVLMVDNREDLLNNLYGHSGEKVVIHHIKRNRSQISALLG